MQPQRQMCRCQHRAQRLGAAHKPCLTLRIFDFLRNMRGECIFERWIQMAACGIVRPVLLPAEYAKRVRRYAQLVKILRQRYLTQLIIVMRFIKIPDKFRQGIIWCLMVTAVHKQKLPAWRARQSFMKPVLKLAADSLRRIGQREGVEIAPVVRQAERQKLRAVRRTPKHLVGRLRII